MGHRLWLPAVAIHRLGGVEIAPSPHHCFRTAHPCAQSVNCSPTEPVLTRSSRQRLSRLQSHFDGGWHVCQAVFPELQSAAGRRRVEQSQLTDCVLSMYPHLLIVFFAQPIPVHRRSESAGRASAASSPNLVVARASVSWLFHICSLV